MGRIVVSEFVTLDGVIEDPGGAEKSPHGGWAFGFERGEAGDAFKHEELASADALLLGRRTYEGFAAAWPQMNDNPFGQRMNGIPKYVVSRTLTEAMWQNSTIVSGELAAEMQRLKDEVGELLVAGSGQLVRELHRIGLIDEYRLMLFPITLGAGQRMFEDADVTTRLRLIDSRPAADTLLLRYERA